MHLIHTFFVVKSSVGVFFLMLRAVSYIVRQPTQTNNDKIDSEKVRDWAGYNSKNNSNSVTAVQ